MAETLKQTARTQPIAKRCFIQSHRFLSTHCKHGRLCVCVQFSIGVIYRMRMWRDERWSSYRLASVSAVIGAMCSESRSVRLRGADSCDRNTIELVVRVYNRQRKPIALPLTISTQSVYVATHTNGIENIRRKNEQIVRDMEPKRF